MYSRDIHLLFEGNRTGFGDKMLGMIGFIVLCKYINATPYILFNSENYNYIWGNNVYDTGLFVLDDVSIQFITSKMNTKINWKIKNHSSVSLSPYKLFKYLTQTNKIQIQNVDYEIFSQEYNKVASKIRPSPIIEQYIPANIQNCYGVHLRKTDKIQNYFKCGYEMNHDEFSDYVSVLLSNLKSIIHVEYESTNPVKLLFVSEDLSWKEQFISLLKSECDSPFEIVSIEYPENPNIAGFNSVLDMFCLSRCKRIYQGVKYSSFSLCASLIGNVPLINYSYMYEYYKDNWLYLWESTIFLYNHPDYYSENEIEKECTELDFTYVSYNIFNI